MADGGIVPVYNRWKGSVIHFAICEGSAAGYAGIDVELYHVPVILVNDESAISGREELIKLG